MSHKTRNQITGIALVTIGLSLIFTFVLIASRTARADPGVLYAAPAAQGSGDCSSWATACTLQTALAQSVSSDEIWVQAGIHYPGSTRTDSFNLQSGVVLYGGFAGNETSREQRDWQANVTVLSGDIDQNDLTDTNGVVTDTAHITGTNTYHVVTSSGTDETAVLDGFVITAGQANGAVFSEYAGGGVYNENGSPTLSNITFSGNFASFGGGMYNHGNPSLLNITFSGNTAGGGSGGGIYNYGSPTLVNVTFSGNSTDHDGGGMYNWGSPTLVNVAFSGNTASVGGGGMTNFSDSNPTLTNVTFSGNSATDFGGGINNGQNNPTLTNVILWGNSAPNGAGIYNVSGTPQISYSDIQDCGGSDSWNSACGADGGGNIEADPLFVDAANGDLRLQDNSPAINAGDNAALPPGILTDLDGNPRFVGVVVDMGAYENQTFLCPAGGVLYVDQDATGVQTGESWIDALVTLQDALQVTEACEIWVKAGVYYPDQGGSQADNDRSATFALKSGVALYGGFAGTETSRDQRDWQANLTIMSGDIDQNDLTDPTGVVTNTAYIIGTNAYHVVTASGVTQTAVLDGFVITAGLADNFNFGGDPLNYYGAGLYNRYGSPALANLIFRGNEAAGDGGGMYNLSGSPALTAVVFSSNRSAYGGGIFNLMGNPTLVSVTFTGNQVTTSGGGLYNSWGSPILTDVIFDNNSADHEGGGMFNSGNATLTNVIFNGNSATEGGGMLQGSGSPTLANVTFGGNTANNAGGGMYNAFSNSTLINVIVWGNSAPDGAGIYNDSSTPHISTSDVQGCGSSGSWNSVCGADGGGNINADPLFVDAASGDLRLQDTSPAINAGNNAALPPGLLTDLDGNPRFVSVFVDMGAYENQTFLCPAGGILYVDQDAIGLQTGASWEDALVTLQDALQVTEVCEIWVAEGVYYPDEGGSQADDDRHATFALKNDLALYGGFAGTETSREQRNWTTNLTVLSGDIDQNDLTDPNGVVTDTAHITGINAYHVVTGSGTNETAILDGFSITAGQANGAAFPDMYGGGMLNSGNPTLTNLTFSGNMAVDTGGGMTSDGNPTLTNVTFSNNTAFHGGGMANGAGSPRLTNVTFSGNSADEDCGGMRNFYTTPTLTNVTFSGNTAVHGGGMCSSLGNSILTNVTFSGNTAEHGGGMFNSESDPSLTNVTFNGNSADSGGGISNWYGSNPTLINVTFSSNSANINGGGMTNYDNSNPALTNVILWGNTAPNGAGIYNDGSTPQISYSDIQGCGGSGSWNSACGVDGGGNIEADPLFVDAANGDLRLQLASPAIDAGDNAALPLGILTDLDGNPRFVDIPTVPDTGSGAPPIVDMGAYEAQYVDVALGKAVLPPAAVPGETITFTLAVSNTGSLPATGIVVSDTLPAILWGVSITSTLTVTDTGALPPYVWQVQDLARGQGGVITVSGVLTLPLAAGTYTNTAFISAADDLLATNNTAVITCTVPNVVPVFTSAPVITATEAAPYTYSATTEDDNGDALTITAPTLPAWLSLVDHGDGTATLAGTPKIADVGERFVALRVADSGGLTDTQSFTITVAYINDAPTFTSAPVTTATQDALYSYTVTAADPDLIHGDALTITTPTLPAWLTLVDHGNGTATLAGTPANADVGEHPVVLQVTDRGGLTDTQTFTITIANVNDAPTFTSAPVTTATEDALYAYAVTAADPDLIHGDALTITAITLPVWLTFEHHGDGTATLSGTPTNADVGAHAVALLVTDSGGLTDTQAFTITVANVNDPPMFTSTPALTATQDAPYAYAVTADDPDLIHGDALTITAITLPVWLTFEDHGDGTATLSGTPANADVGAYAVALLVTDSGGLTDTQTFTITVANVNDPPTFTSTPVLTVAQGSPYAYAVTADDPDLIHGDALTITAITLPAWLTLEDHGDGTATLSGTPASADVGDHPVVLLVTDSGRLTNTQTFTITVWGRIYLPLVLRNTP